MIQLKKDLKKIKNYYKTLKRDYLFDSILEGFSSANMCVNVLNNPTLSMVVQEKAVYFGGEDDNLDQYHEVIDYFINNVLKNALNSGLYFLKVIFTSKEWEKALKNSLNDFEYKVLPR